ncbi:TetR family transcriptional regulator [Murinocardiopsis flavida]|uniref:TetR family transcriptional regulator n=1 Tax=Murinocardiopsis flavida TaxID=645275 RepID=A0A2P8DP72_9ACTN|nr:TetR/AcrR family transcriptional regulator [Murinocardiopsis flavida]PSK99006.1 TetR family transcriptional regulator [Murinocardiopsis flavida]
MTEDPAKPAGRGLRADASRNRERIIHSATALLAHHPAATMDELTAACGLGRTTVYRHFHTREELVAAVYAGAFAGVRQVFADAGLHECDPDVLLDRAVQASIRALNAYPVLVSGPGPEAAGEAGGRLAACLEPLELAMRAAQRHGLLDGSLPPRWLASSLLDDCAGAVLFAAELRARGHDPGTVVRGSFERAWAAG